MSLYHDLIIDHYKNPRNFGTLEKPDLVAKEANASCGDLIEFQLKFDKFQNSEFRIQNLAWRGVGCAISAAAASLLSERVKSKKYGVREIMKMTDEEMVEMLGGDISPTRLKCATLSLKALKKAFKQSMQKYKAKVSSHELLAGSFEYLHLELLNPDRIEFKAGQYIILTIDAANGVRRNYSIASQPAMDHAIELLVDIKPAGPGSEFLKNLQAGNEIEFIGPFGNFIVFPECSTVHELLFVATGSGISPIRAMILDLLIVKKYQGSIKLWWGMRNQEDCFWTEDFDELEKEYPNFKWDLVLSSPPADWPLHSGHVTSHVLDYVQNKDEGRRTKDEGQKNSDLPSAFSLQPSAFDFCFYLCGNRFMIEEVSTKLKETGINGEHIHTEKFF